MAIPAVVIDFATRGLADVGRAFETIEQRIVRFEKQATREAQAGSKARVRVATDEAKAADRTWKDVAKAATRAERDKTRAAETETRRREGIVRKSSEMAGRYASQIAKEEQREAEKATRAVEREEDRKMAIRRRSAEMAGRLAARQAAEELAAQKSALTRSRQDAIDAQGVWAGRGRKIGGIMAGSVGGVLSTGLTAVSATLGIGGGMMLADAARREMSAERQAALLVNTVTTGSKPPAEASVSNILSQAGALSKTLGIDKSEIVSGALEYSRKARGGDIKGALGNMGFFAEMSKVTGADIGDIAAAAGTLQSQNQNLGTTEMRQMLLDVYAQGKAGSLSMVDVSKQLGVMASARGAFSGDVATNQRKLLALGQLAAPEGSPEEAGTFIKDLVMEAGKHRKTTKDTIGLEQMGVKYDKFGRMESPEQMIDQVFRGTKGDITQIEKLFGARGKALFGALLNPYTSAGGGEAGIAAVNRTLSSVTGATMTEEQLHSQNAQIDATPAARFHNALNKITEDIEEKLAPRMENFAETTLPKLIPKFEAIIDEAAKLADYFADNPLKGIGLIVAAAVTKDLAAAGISAAAEAGVGAILKKIAAMVGSGGGSGGGVPVPNPPSGGGGGGSNAFNKFATGAAVVAAVANAGEAAYSSWEGMHAGSARGEARSQQLLADIRAGKVGAKDVKAVIDSASGTEVAKASLGQTAAMADRFLTGGAVTAMTGAKGVGERTDQIAEMAAIASHAKEFTAALDAATKGIKTLGAIASETGSGASRRNQPIASRPVQ